MTNSRANALPIFVPHVVAALLRLNAAPVLASRALRLVTCKWASCALKRNEDRLAARALKLPVAVPAATITLSKLTLFHRALTRSAHRLAARRNANHAAALAVLSLK